jgi:hypothetical protein
MPAEYTEEMPAVEAPVETVAIEPKTKGRPKKTEAKSEAEEVAEDIPF